jgi:hypothetical protein
VPDEEKHMFPTCFSNGDMAANTYGEFATDPFGPGLTQAGQPVWHW